MSGVPLCSIRDVWYHNLEKFPTRTAVVCEGTSHTYAECDLLSDRLRAGLAGRWGFAKGDKVAIAGPACIEYFLSYWAAIKSGAIVVPVNTRLATSDVSHILTRSDAEILVVHNSSWPAVQKALSDQCPVRHVVGIGFDRDGVASFESIVEGGGDCDYHPAIAEDDLAIIMHTSGTTGRPKGAMMRHGDLLFNNKLAIYAHSLRHEDVHLLVVPMFHATALYSLLPTSALLGSTIVLAPKSGPRYLAGLIQEHGITTFFGVPMMFGQLCQLPDLGSYDLQSLRVIAYAGATMPVATILRLRELFPHAMLHNFFGLTETISMTHVLPSRDAVDRAESIGKLLPQVSQRILDEDGEDVPPGEVGRLHFHRSNVICGYWKDPDRMEQSVRGDWFDTGDLATVDDEGYVYLKGRSKDMIIVGGENVYSLEVERCIMTHGGVMDAAVVGIPATGVRVHLGELIKAVVVPCAGTDLTEADIKRHCAQRLASYMVPHIVEFRPELPRNPTGKLLKRLLRS